MALLHLWSLLAGGWWLSTGCLLTLCRNNISRPNCLENYLPHQINSMAFSLDEKRWYHPQLPHFWNTGNLLLRFPSLSLMTLRSALMLQKQCWHLHSHYKILLHCELKLLHSRKGDPNTSSVQVGEQGVTIAQRAPEGETQCCKGNFLVFLPCLK